MDGKSICKILKQIREEIARKNDIAFVTSECEFQGECTGTCPKCEAEVQYLKQELSKRSAEGKPVEVVGIAASVLDDDSNSPASENTENDEPWWLHRYGKMRGMPADFEMLFSQKQKQVKIEEIRDWMECQPKQPDKEMDEIRQRILRRRQEAQLLDMEFGVREEEN